MPRVVLTSDEEERASSEKIQKEMFTLLGSCRGHNCLRKISKYYAEPSKDWPAVESRVLNRVGFYFDFLGAYGIIWIFRLNLH